MRALFLLLLSCLPCFAQLNVQQPMFALTSTGFQPPSGNLVIWHKPETLSGTNNQELNNWIDSSSYNHYATNKSVFGAGLLPLLKSPAIDGFNAMTFPGNCYCNWLSNGGPAVLRNVPGASAYIVFAATNSDVSWGPFDFSSNAGGDRSRLSFTWVNSPAQFWLRTVSTDASFESQATLNPFTFTTDFYLASMVVVYTNQTANSWTNGVAFAANTPTWTKDNTSDTDSGFTYFGRSYYGYFKGYIVEFLLYNIPHDAATRRGIETNYFKVKYTSIPIN